MGKNREHRKIFQSKFSFSEKRNRANLLLFSKFGAVSVLERRLPAIPSKWSKDCRGLLVYLSGDSRPSPAVTTKKYFRSEVYLSGDSRPSPASAVDEHK